MVKFEMEGRNIRNLLGVVEGNEELGGKPGFQDFALFLRDLRKLRQMEANALTGGKRLDCDPVWARSVNGRGTPGHQAPTKIESRIDF
jgi:hypothetical protein